MRVLPVRLILFGRVMKLMRLGRWCRHSPIRGCLRRLIIPLGDRTCLCLIPRTAVLGAIRMTCLLGGATLTELRIAHPAYPLPVFLEMPAWGGLYLRDVRLRELTPLRKP